MAEGRSSPFTPSPFTCCCPSQAGASICLSPLPGKPSTFPPETTKCAVVSGICPLILSLLPLGDLLGTVSLVVPEPGG